ncbi:hypothetical protein OG203_26930 [Nocardia sp. NBC_01499]|uniref:hypothetical protein n=1 Tax=Nocardia sp. NBC_01499 TaxID=2903597 RepID=UPI00386B32B2
MDPTIAGQILALEEHDGENASSPTGPTPEGYTLHTYLLLSIIDGLQGVQAAVIAAAGATPPTVKPMPRPVTALDLIRDERRLQSMQKLIDEFTAPQDEDGPNP